MEYKQLYNGFTLPKIVLGTYKTKGADFKRLIADAYETGYRALDSATLYDNEKEIGDAMRSLGIRMTVTTKVWNDMHGYKEAKEAFERSEEALGGVDVLLIHWPGKELYVETWAAFEELYEQGRVKAIGLSNFLTHHIEEVISQCKIKPMVNQLETNVFYVDNKTIDFCRSNDITVEAWRPLMKKTDNLQNDKITAIANKYGRSNAQIALKYLLQNDLIVLPKTVHKERMQQNIDLYSFTLDEEDMRTLASLNTGIRSGEDPDLYFPDGKKI